MGRRGKRKAEGGRERREGEEKLEGGEGEGGRGAQHQDPAQLSYDSCLCSCIRGCFRNSGLLPVLGAEPWPGTSLVLSEPPGWVRSTGSVFTHNASDTKHVVSLPPPSSPTSRCQLGVPQFSAKLTPTTWGQRSPQAKGSVPQGGPTCGCKSQLPTCASDPAAIHREGPTTPSSGSVICY